MSFAVEEENSLHGVAREVDAVVYDHVVYLFYSECLVIGDTFVHEMLAA